MINNEPEIDRRTYLTVTGATATSMVSLAGCTGGSATGTLATQVTDQPGDIDDFESCVVTIVGMWLGPADVDAEDRTDGDATDREYYEYDEPREADLVDLQGDNTALVDERELEAATHAFLQLDTDGIDATLDDGSSATIETPGEAPLTFNQGFDVREDTRTVFTADFTPVKRGQTGSYVLQPVPDGITVEYEES